MAKHRKVSRKTKKMAAITAAMAIPAVAGTMITPAIAHADDLDVIEQCESGGRNVMNSSGSSAGGYYQITKGTWADNGGLKYAPSAIQATKAEQRAVAERLYASRGTQPWDASSGCWGGKTSGSVSEKGEPKKAKPVNKAQKKASAKKVVEKKATPVKKAQPKVEKVVASSTPAAAKNTPGGDGLYTVQTGDTLSHLAKTYGTSVERLMELNKDVIEMPNWIFAGERIHLS